MWPWKKKVTTKESKKLPDGFVEAYNPGGLTLYNGRFVDTSGIQQIQPTSQHELQIKQAQALTTLAEGVSSIAAFLTGGGLPSLLSGYARSQAVKDILGGLASHDGRNALDARTMGQNALEIVAQVETVFAKYEEKLKDKEKRDPELYDIEVNFKDWAKKIEEGRGKFK